LLHNGGDYQARHKKSMVKKLAIIFAILIAAFVGGWIYFNSRKNPAPIVVENPAPATAPSATAPARSATPSPSEPSVPEAAGKMPPPSAPAAFAPRSGETLEFNAIVPKLNSTIATIRLLVGSLRPIDQKSAWHFQAFAHTENPYRMVFELDDQFDSYSDPANNMASLQYEMHLSERGQKSDSVQRMLPSPDEPAPANATAARVLKGTRDPLGMLQFLRGVDWNKTTEVRSPVYDGRKLYDARASLASRNVSVTVPAGTYNASKIEIHVFENGAEMKDAHFFLYLSNDPSRIPVLMEAVLPVTNARVELTKMK
jgi:Protein of unknown function (DUF3108)